MSEAVWHGMTAMQVRGVRRMRDAIHADARVTATAIQTVGVKGYSGLLMAVVR